MGGTGGRPVDDKTKPIVADLKDGSVAVTQAHTKMSGGFSLGGAQVNIAIAQVIGTVSDKFMDMGIPIGNLVSALNKMNPTSVAFSVEKAEPGKAVSASQGASGETRSTDKGRAV